jgi:hypothetical protein
MDRMPLLLMLPLIKSKLSQPTSSFVSCVAVVVRRIVSVSTVPNGSIFDLYNVSGEILQTFEACYTI